jgi:hypothetical protein
MQAFIHKCSFVLAFILFFLCLSFISSQKSFANQYGTMCNEGLYAGYPGPFQAPPTLNDLDTHYCNNNTNFADISGQDPTTQTAIKTLARMNLIFGYSQADCTAAGLGYPCFKPNNHITRWEVAALIARYHIFIKRDWYAWDPANDPDPAKCDCTPPVKNFDGTYLADIDYYDGGDSEMHTALLNRWIVGGRCDGFYAPDGTTWSDTSGSGLNVYVPQKNRSVRDNERCFGPFGDWVFGFHGVERADAAYQYWTTFPYNGTTANHRFFYCNYASPVQSGPGSCEEAWRGDWYKFATGGDAPYFMTRGQFARAMYDYYVEIDNNNYCATPQTGGLSITGSDTGVDGSGNYCIIHADQTQCSATLTWTSSNTMGYGNVCNYAAVTKPGTYPPNTVGPDVEMAYGKSGTVVSDATTGPFNTKTYKLMYTFDQNDGYISGATFYKQLSQISLSGRYTSGTISFPGGGCTIPSGTATSCTQPISWNTSLISLPNTVTLRDTTNNVLISSSGISGSTNYTISGPTTFTLYENGVALTSQTVTPNKLRSISGTVRVDYNDNAAVDVSPNGPPDGVFTEGTTVTLVNQSNGSTVTTTSNGTGAFSFSNLQQGAYNISIPATITSVNYPDGLHPSTVQTNPIGVALLTQDATVNFYISPYYRVTGGVFVDTNKNGKKDAGESYYTGGAITVTSSNGGTVSYPASGLYQVTNLPYGPQTITYTSSIPNGYVVTIPKGGAGSPSFTVQVGKTCAASPVAPAGGDGACNAAGNMYDINFGISNSTPWIQGVGLDMRFDTGLTNQVPSLSNSCGAIYTMMPSNAADTTTQGGVYIGSSSVNNAFGVRSTPSSKGWVMDTLFPETYKPVVSGTIRTSYAYVLGAVTRAGLTQTDINTDPNCSDPSISCGPANLPSGVYTHTGDVILSSLTLPANRNIILLIKGNLSITGNITVPTTSTLTVAVGDNNAGTAGNITVATSLGSAPACTAVAGQLQGFFTADKSMIISGTNDCTVGTDKMLTIEGAVVVNASLTSGAFTTNRDLCANDTNYPIVVIRERPDFILHPPDVTKQQNYLFREAAP